MDTSAAVAREYMAAWPSDFEKLGHMRAADFVEDWPQSGERIRGDSNYRAIHERYPGGMPAHELETLTGSPRSGPPSSGRWAISPSFTLVHLSGGPEGTYTAEGLLQYQDSRRFNVVAILTIENGKVSAHRTYFAEQFEAPAWRSQWVEKERSR